MATGAVPEQADVARKWAQLNADGVACSCGERHVGLFALVFLRPPGWTGAPDPEPNSALRMDGNFLSQDFCVMEGKYFAVRMIVPLPIQGISPPAAPLAVWASLDRADFEAFVGALAENRHDKPERMQARLITRVGGYPDTFGLMGQAFPQADGPPLLVLERNQAPGLAGGQLVSEHRDGATFDRLLDVYAAHQHDMRASFS
jgi:hypothetical protein